MQTLQVYIPFQGIRGREWVRSQKKERCLLTKYINMVAAPKEKFYNMIALLLLYVSCLILSLIFYFFYERNKSHLVFNSLAAKPLDARLYFLQDSLEEYGRGELSLTKTEFGNCVNDYLSYCPPQLGLAFLVNLSLSYSLSEEAKKILYGTIKKAFQKLPINNTKGALLMLFQDLDLLVLSMADLNPILLKDFFCLLQEILHEKNCFVDNKVVTQWLVLVNEEESFACLIDRINLMLDQAFLRTALIFVVTQVTVLFIGIFVFVVGFVAPSQAVVKSNNLPVAMLSAPTRIP